MKIYRVELGFSSIKKLSNFGVYCGLVSSVGFDDCYYFEDHKVVPQNYGTGHQPEPHDDELLSKLMSKHSINMTSYKFGFSSPEYLLNWFDLYAIDELIKTHCVISIYESIDDSIQSVVNGSWQLMFNPKRANIVNQYTLDEFLAMLR